MCDFLLLIDSQSEHAPLQSYIFHGKDFPLALSLSTRRYGNILIMFWCEEAPRSSNFRTRVSPSQLLSVFQNTLAVRYIAHVHARAARKLATCVVKLANKTRATSADSQDVSYVLCEKERFSQTRES